MAKRVIEYNGNEFNLSYHILSNHASKNIVFLHGWGSNKELMELAFKEHFKDFNHCYIDMPGFGNSPNEIVISTFDYAKIIDKFLKSLDFSPNIILGHSYGGKICLLTECDEIILLSSSGILIPKSFKVKTKIFLSKLFKKLGLKIKSLRSKDADNLNDGMYEVFKQVVNEDFEPYYAQCEKKASIFWGKNDLATPLSSGEKISKLIKNSRFFVLEGDHYFFLKQGKIIEEKFTKGI